MAEPVMIAYIGVEVDTSKVPSQLQNVRQKMQTGLKMQPGLISKQMSRDFQIAATAAQRVSRQISTVLRAITIPAIAGIAKAFHAVSQSQSTAAIAMRYKWSEVMKPLNAQLVRMAELISQSRVFGKTIYEWVDALTKFLAGLDDKKIQKFIDVLKAMAVALVGLKAFDMSLSAAKTGEKLASRFKGGSDKGTIAGVVGGELAGSYLTSRVIGAQITKRTADLMSHIPTSAAAVVAATRLNYLSSRKSGLMDMPEAYAGGRGGGFRNKLGQFTRVEAARIRGTSWEGYRSQVGESVSYFGAQTPKPKVPGLVVGSLGAAGTQIRAFLAGWGGIAAAGIASVSAVAAWLGIIKSKLKGEEISTSTTSNIKSGLGIILTAVKDMVEFIPNLTAYLAAMAGGGGKDWKKNYEKMMLGMDEEEKAPAPGSMEELKKWSKDQDYEEISESKKAWFQYYRDMNQARREYMQSQAELNKQMNQEMVDAFKSMINQMGASADRVKSINKRGMDLEQDGLNLERQNRERLHDFQDKFDELAIVMGGKGKSEAEVLSRAKMLDKKRQENIGSLGYTGTSVGYAEAGKFATGIQVDFQKQQESAAKEMLDMWKQETRSRDEHTRAVQENTKALQENASETVFTD